MDTYMDFLQKNLDVNELKRNVSSNNIANYNTPNFKASQVNTDQLFSDEFGDKLKQTSTKHLSSFSSQEDAQVVTNTTSKQRSDGNNVDLTSEMIEMMKSNSHYTKAIQAINKEFLMIRTALGK